MFQRCEGVVWTLPKRGHRIKVCFQVLLLLYFWRCPDLGQIYCDLLAWQTKFSLLSNLLRNFLSSWAKDMPVFPHSSHFQAMTNVRWNLVPLPFYLWICFRLNRRVPQTDICNPMFITATFTTAKTRKQPKCPPTDKWIKKTHIWRYLVRIYNGILLSHEKNEIMPFAATWMELEVIIQCKLKSNKERQIYIAYM